MAFLCQLIWLVSLVSVKKINKKKSEKGTNSKINKFSSMWQLSILVLITAPFNTSIIINTQPIQSVSISGNIMSICDLGLFNYCLPNFGLQKLLCALPLRTWIVAEPPCQLYTKHIFSKCQQCLFFFVNAKNFRFANPILLFHQIHSQIQYHCMVLLTHAHSSQYTQQNHPYQH